MCSHECAVVNCINHILSYDTTKLKNFSTPHGEILDPPLNNNYTNNVSII